MDKFQIKTILVSVILGLCLGIICTVICLNKNKPVLDEFQADYHELVNDSKENQNGYFCKETQNYLIEIFPIGEADYDLTSEVSGIPENTRLAKISWYNKARTKVEHYYYNEIVYQH